MNVTASLFDGNIPLMMEKAKDGPVFIMRDNQPEYVLLTIETYEALIVPTIGTEVDPQ